MSARAHRFFTAVVVVGAAIGSGCSSTDDPVVDASVDQGTPVDASVDEGTPVDAAFDAPLLADAGQPDLGQVDANVSEDAGEIDEGIVLIL